MEAQQPPQGLHWARLPDGRFYLDLTVQTVTDQGVTLQVPVQRFILSQEEEGRLLTSLTGLVAATAAPVNGLHLVRGK